METEEKEGRNRLMATRSHSSAFALSLSTSACPAFQGPCPLLRGESRLPHGAGRERRGLGRKSGSLSKRLCHFLFFPFRDSEGAFSHVEAACALPCMRPAWLFLVYAALVRSNDGHEKKELRCRTRNGQHTKKNSQYSCIPPTRLHYPSLSCSLPGPIAACA